MYVRLSKVKVLPMKLHSYLTNEGREEEIEWFANKDGYLVIDDDNMEEWCEKGFFLNKYSNTSKGIPFGMALELLKSGEVITRKKWGDYRRYVFMRPGDEIGLDLIPRIKSIPTNVKSNLVRGDADVKFTPYLCYKDSDNVVHNAWMPSTEDLLAEDWVTLDIDD